MCCLSSFGFLTSPWDWYEVGVPMSVSWHLFLSFVEMGKVLRLGAHWRTFFSLYDWRERGIFQCAPIFRTLSNFSESIGREEGDWPISALRRVALVVSMVGRLDVSLPWWQFRQLSCISLRISTLGRADLWKFCFFPKSAHPQNNNLGRINRFSNIMTLWCNS